MYFVVIKRRTQFHSHFFFVYLFLLIVIYKWINQQKKIE